jgi:hypothetical protein
MNKYRYGGGGGGGANKNWTIINKFPLQQWVNIWFNDYPQQQRNIQVVPQVHA